MTTNIPLFLNLLTANPFRSQEPGRPSLQLCPYSTPLMARTFPSVFHVSITETRAVCVVPT